MPLHSINSESRLYVLACGAGFTCLGFDVAERWRAAVLEWLGETVEPVDLGTAEHFAAYDDAMTRGAEHNRRTGARCEADLKPQLRGLEGHRVEVVEPNGERRRFIVGKSTGWFPCHLEIARRNSHDGSPAYLPDGATVRPLYNAR